jgi:hypothetical protein
MNTLLRAIRAGLREEEMGGEGSSGGGLAPAEGQVPAPTPQTTPTSDFRPSATQIREAQEVDDSDLDPAEDFMSIVGDGPEVEESDEGQSPGTPPPTLQPPAQAPAAQPQPPQQPTQQKEGEGQTPSPVQPARPEGEVQPPEGQTPEQSPQPPTQPQVPQEPQMPAGPTAEELQAQADAIRQQLVQNYTLDETALAQFEENPGEVLSTMAANLHMQVMQDITRGIMSTLPQVITNVVESQKRGQELEKQFFDKWPKLAERKAEAIEVAKMYRNMRKDLSPEAFIQEAGMHAMVLLGIPLDQAPQESAPPPQTPPVPPVQRGAPVVPGGAQPQRNLFEVLSEEDIEDD